MLLRTKKSKQTAAINVGSFEVVLASRNLKSAKTLILPICQLVGYMGGSDISQQVWNYYTASQHPHRRTWWPMLWAELDATIGNIVEICHLEGEEDSQRSIQTTIGYRLCRRPAATLRKHTSSTPFRPSDHSEVQQELGEDTQLPLSQIPTLSGAKRRECVNCKPRRRPRRTRAVLAENTTNAPQQRPRRTRYGCEDCRVALCDNGVCWAQWHRRERVRYTEDD